MEKDNEHKVKGDEAECKLESDIAEARKVLDEYLSGKGRRKTPERYAIMETVLREKGHLSADDIYEIMSDTFRVTRPTVYSTLQLLDELGIVQTHHLAGKALYEPVYGKEPHHHYICTLCGKMWDFVDPNVARVAVSVKTPRFTKLRGAMYIYGHCSVCQSKITRQRRRDDEEREANLTREERRFRRLGIELAEAAKEWASVQNAAADKPTE